MAMKRARHKARTAGELLAELEADPAYQERKRQQEALGQALDERIRESEAPLVRDLRKAGLAVDSVWDLVNTASPYAAAIPVLLEHFEADYIPEVREGIARALAVPEASWAWDVLLTFYRREPSGGLRDVKYALALALAGAGSVDHIDGLIALVQDPSLGSDRLAFPRTLLNANSAKARAALETLREDPDLKKELRALLGRPKKQ